MMTKVLIFLALLSCSTARADFMEDFVDSSSLKLDPLVLFHDTWRSYHEQQAETIKNWKGMTKSKLSKLTPSKDLQEREYKAIVAVSYRFWKGKHAEMMMYGLGALMLSESAAVNIGNPNDPSFGVLHVKTALARTMSDSFGFSCPSSEKDIKRKLSNDIEYNVLVGTCEFSVMMSSFNENPRFFPKTLMGYKMGLAGATRWMNANSNSGISKLPIVKSYKRNLKALLLKRAINVPLLKEKTRASRNRS